jgi:DNA ligase-1
MHKKMKDKVEDPLVINDSLFSPSSGVLLAKNFFDKNQKHKIDPIGWWASEKFDGIRAIWTGTKLISRTGKVITAPPKWLSLLPSNTSFDGELFTRRGQFNLTSSIVSKKIPLEHEWEHIIFNIFDIPHLRETFEKRVQILNETIKIINSHKFISVKHIQITSYDHLMTFYHQVTSINGEGLMLRKPFSLYDAKRSNSLLKVKMFLDDDAIIIAHIPGQGRLLNALGSFLVHWVHDSSVVFNVGTGLDDSIRFSDYSSLFSIGSVISVKYFELFPSGVPRFPIFIGKRFEQP